MPAFHQHMNAIAVMLECMSEPKGATMIEIIEKTGLGRGAVMRWIKHFHKRKRPVIYIIDWDRFGDTVDGVLRTRGFTARYAVGFMVEDAVRPKRKSRREVERDYNLRKAINEGRGPQGVRDAQLRAKRQAITGARSRDELGRLHPKPA